jgi:hypothetical protein
VGRVTPRPKSLTKHTDAKADTKLVKKLAPSLSVKHAKTATSALTAGNATNLGGVSASGYQTKVLWAHVAADGTIISQSGGISVSATTGSGGYYLNFGTPTTGKAITVSLSDIDQAFGGTPLATPCGGGTGATTCFATGTNDANHVFVFTSNATNDGGLPHAFYITVTQ